MVAVGWVGGEAEADAAVDAAVGVEVDDVVVEDLNLKGISGLGCCLVDVTGCSGVDIVVDAVVEGVAACVAVVVAAVAEPAEIVGTGEAAEEDRRRKARYM